MLKQIKIFSFSLTFFISAILLMPYLEASLTKNIPDNYESWSAHKKLNFLWVQIVKTAYETKQLPNLPPILLMGSLLNSNYLVTTFSHSSDLLPRGRTKLIHTFGSVAKVSFKPAPNRFTGIFESGAEGLIRLSLAGPLPSYTPGFGLKFMVDGQPSLNIMAMYSLDGQGKDRNFFSHAFTTTIERPSSKFLQVPLKAFSKAVQLFNPNASPFILPVGHFASLKADGTAVSGPIIPKFLKFVPALLGFDTDDKTDLRKQLMQLAPGTVLYHVYAQGTEGQSLEYLGELVLQSNFTASSFGDQELFFRHHPALGKDWL